MPPLFSVSNWLPVSSWKASLPVQRAPEANTTFAELESESVPDESLCP